MQHHTEDEVGHDWENRYQKEDTPWDIGYPSTPVKEYIDQLDNKELNILIPGCGNAYEAAYLWENKFKNVHLIDIAQSPLAAFAKQHLDFPKPQLIQGDFFKHTGAYDLIIEQTFFCAIHPSLRPSYAKKVFELLKPDGKLVGLLFDDPLNDDHPPYGGSKIEYIKYFKPYFNFKHFETAYNSIPPRAGRELFIEFVKRK